MVFSTAKTLEELMDRLKSEDKRNAILDAATRVFAERGLAAADIRDIKTGWPVPRDQVRTRRRDDVRLSAQEECSR
jgi:hypothetical protein